MNVIIFDTETTGLLKPSAAPLADQPQIIELGALVIENGNIIEERTWLFNPGVPLPAIITKITGLTDADLATKPAFGECWDDIALAFYGCDALIAHNAQFDIGMLTNEFARLSKGFTLPKKVICTVQAYRHLFNKFPKLTELYQLILKKPLEQKHRAIDDCMALYEILKADKFFDIIEVAP